YLLLYCSFFFQAEDGIRDRNVTGVQTCLFRSHIRCKFWNALKTRLRFKNDIIQKVVEPKTGPKIHLPIVIPSQSAVEKPEHLHRSEERRVGKESISRGAEYHIKRKKR